MRWFFISFLWCFLSQAAEEKIVLNNRQYLLVSPENPRPHLPMLVLLHGCKQDSEIIAQGTELAELAITREFFLLVPEQKNTSNLDRCWNWFFPEMQNRLPVNEMGEIIQAIQFISRIRNIDLERIYLAGLSAGGALAENFLACYPDYFNGIAIHSGLAYKSAENIKEAQNVLTSSVQKNPKSLAQKAHQCSEKYSPRRKLSKIMIIHGAQDLRVLPLHSRQLNQTHQYLMDLWDDSALNQSDNPIVKNYREIYPGQYMANIRIAKYRHLVEKTIIIEGLQHAWGGGVPVSSNFDPLAPSSTWSIIHFFNL